MMLDAELYARSRDGLASMIALFGTSSEGARLLRWPGVIASVVPATPERSMFNASLFDSRAALDREYEALAHAYASAGVQTFSVWTDPDDTAQAELLRARGLKLNGSPTAMAAEIATLTLPDRGDLQWEHTDSAQLVARINESAYGFKTPAWERAFTRVTDPRARMYIALDRGVPAASVLTLDGDYGDCAVCGVATLPAHQRRALASRLLALALREAAGRGAITTSLQSSSQGQSVYARLGYRDLGGLRVWEHR